MADKRSIIAFEHYREGEQRFEYFITGVSTALCAYVGQTLQSQKFGFNSYTLEVLSVGLVVASIVLGFKRIQDGIFINQLNSDRLHKAEVRGELVLSSRKGQPFINKQTGDVITPIEAQKQIAYIEQVLPVRNKQIKSLQAKVAKLYRWRNRLLLCGFIGLFVSKILPPYLH